MRRTILVVSLLLVFVIPFSVYVIAAGGDGQPDSNSKGPPDLTAFTAVVNGVRRVDVDVPVDVDDGVTTKEAEVIAELTFNTVMGPHRVHRGESLTLTSDQLIVQATWGYDENDLSHVFYMIGDFTTRQIMVSHCF